MYNVARSLGALSTFKIRSRFHAMAVGGALAIIAGLSAQDVTATNSDTPTLTGITPVAASAEQPATPAEAAAAPAAAPAPAGLPEAQLHPLGVPSGGQQAFAPSEEQLRNAKAIVDAGKAMNLPPRAQVIAVATAMQESTLKNLGHLGDRNDHDSQGLFQQRPSSGWGSPAQITDPTYASTAFYKGLVDVQGWDQLSLTQAAQKVQVSAYPDHYAKWEKAAGDVVNGFYGAGPYAQTAATIK